MLHHKSAMAVPELGYTELQAPFRKSTWTLDIVGRYGCSTVSGVGGDVFM